MYFHTTKGKQHLNLKGDLILTHNPSVVMARNKSAAPRYVRNGKYIQAIATMGAWGRLKATMHAIRFIWGADQSLTTEEQENERS